MRKAPAASPAGASWKRAAKSHVPSKVSSGSTIPAHLAFRRAHDASTLPAGRHSLARRARRSVECASMVIRPGVAAVIFDDGRVLLQRRDDTRRWGLPGGAVDPGESVRDAVIREVLEETGLDVEPVRLIGVYSDPVYHQVMTYPDGNLIHYVSTVFECVA